MNTPSLSSLIQEEIAATEEADPSVIATRVLMRLDPTRLEQILLETLRDRVRIELGRHRTTTTTNAARCVGTSKWDYFRALCLNRVMVGSGWKLLGDCSAAEMDELAEAAEARAAEQVATAGRYREYASHMRAAGAAVFADLLDAGEAAAA